MKGLWVVLAVVFSFFGAPSISADEKRYERDYQFEWCEQYGGEAEVRLPDNARVDCILAPFAIEFDFAKKWAEAPFQAYLYAADLDLQPAIVLIMRSDSDCKYLARLYRAMSKANASLVIWQTGDYQYRCPPVAQ